MPRWSQVVWRCRGLRRTVGNSWQHCVRVTSQRPLARCEATWRPCNECWNRIRVQCRYMLRWLKCSPACAVDLRFDDCVRSINTREVTVSRYAKYECLKVEVADKVATVMLNRPQARNAINQKLIRE